MLIDNIKTMLDIDSNCVSEDAKLNLIIENGKGYLLTVHPLLTESDFEKPSTARKLLFNYCRYAYSNASEEFENNYKPELMRLRQEYEVMNRENQNEY